jgi:tetratricopeptide (TPR) repeat protein
MLWWILASAKTSKGDLVGAQVELNRSIQLDDPWPGQWLLAALLAAKQGHTEEGSAWYQASTEWLGKLNPVLRPPVYIKNLAAELLQLTEIDPDKQSPEMQIQRLGKLLEKYPNCGSLYFRRGMCQARQGAWDRARQDFQKAAAHGPHAFQYWCALAVTALYLNDTKGYEDACRQAFDRVVNHCVNETRAGLVTLCCLGKVPGIDPARLINAAQDAKEGTGTFWQRRALLMSLYRAGKWEEAFDQISSTEDSPLYLLFAALTNQKLGNQHLAKRLLRQARDIMDKKIPTPQGPEWSWDEVDRPILWAMLQVAQREIAKEDGVNPAKR